MNLGKWALMASLLSAATGVLATEQYPAADFQPKVVFQDPALVGASSSVAADKKAHKADSAAHDQSGDFDPRFPAANFQPKVIFSAK